jgi:septal ring factor EnvC (AmiA/AmiB activator)
VLLAALPQIARASQTVDARPHARLHRAFVHPRHAHAAPATAPSAQPAPPTLEPIPDLSHAVPARDIGKLPSTAEQFRALNSEMGKERPAVADAKAKSDALRDEAEAMRRKLIESAARVQDLEAEKVGLDADIAQLAAQDRALSASFARDRISVARLLAVLERLQHDAPPAMALRPDDALGAARGAMLIGASLPRVYGEAADLVHRIALLKATRTALMARRADGVRNAAQLTNARAELNQLLASKEIEARAAASDYDELKGRLDTIAARATNLAMLLEKVAALRSQPAPQDLVVVGAESGVRGTMRHGSLLVPVVGSVVTARDAQGPGPGMTFATAGGAEVVSPADGKVLFSGPYHKYGHVLILETALGYDAVLAGLDHVDVRPEDRVLAGEPVGTMPKSGTAGSLYFELRQNGRGIDPAPFLVIELRKAKRT